MSSYDEVVMSDGENTGIFHLNNDTFTDLSGLGEYSAVVGPSTPGYTPSYSILASSSNLTLMIGRSGPFASFIGEYSPKFGVRDISSLFPSGESFDVVSWSGHDFVLLGQEDNGSAPAICVFNPESGTVSVFSTDQMGNVGLIDSATLRVSNLVFASFNTKVYSQYSVYYSYYGLMNLSAVGHLNVKVNAFSNITVGAETYVASEVDLPEFPGVYHVTVQSKGYMPYSENVTVYPFETVNLTVDLKEVVTTSTVAFYESGLPAGTAWSVTLDGNTQSSSSDVLVFEEPNGNYSYAVSLPSGYYGENAKGSIAVSGSPVNVSVIAQREYSVTFSESGLPHGSWWSVTLNGTTKSSNKSSITFKMPSGTYAYALRFPSGYTSSKTTGTVQVVEENTSVPIAVIASEHGIALSMVAVTAGTVVAVLAAILALRRRRQAVRSPRSK